MMLMLHAALFLADAAGVDQADHHQAGADFGVA